MIVDELSAAEARALRDGGFYAAKASLDLKIKAIFGEMQTALSGVTARYAARMPPEVAISGRMYQGEHFREFPWRALDHAAVFSREGIFAYRSLVVLGSHMSVHLLLSGRYMEMCVPLLEGGRAALGEAGFLVSVQDSLWDWGLGDHVAVSGLGAAELDRVLREREFVKLSMGCAEFGEFPEVAVRGWETLARILFSA